MEAKNYEVRKRLIKLIKDSGLKRQEFADKVGISNSGLNTYIKIEKATGKPTGRIPRADILEKIVNYVNKNNQGYQISVDWLLTGKEHKEAIFSGISISKDVLEKYDCLEFLSSRINEAIKKDIAPVDLLEFSIDLLKAEITELRAVTNKKNRRGKLIPFNNHK